MKLNKSKIWELLNQEFPGKIISLCVAYQKRYISIENSVDIIVFYLDKNDTKTNRSALKPTIKEAYDNILETLKTELN